MEGEGSRRSKRDKKKTAASETLAKLKHSRETGEKLDVEIKADEGIFEYVDDKEYNRILRKRQADSWVLDDAGLGYVDSGREVFDEEYDSDEEEGAEERGDKEPDSKKRKKGKLGKSSIKDMLLRTKPKDEEKVTLDGDDLLGECLDQLSSGSSKPTGKVPDIKFRSFSKPKPSMQQSPAKMDWGKVPSSFVKLRERPTWTPPTSTSKNSLKVEPMEFDDHLLDSAVDDDVGGTNEHVVNVGGANGDVKEIGGSIKTIKEEVPAYEDDEFDFADDAIMDMSCADAEREVEGGRSTVKKEVEGGRSTVKKEPQQMRYQAEEKAGMWDIGWETVKGQTEGKEQMEAVASSAVGDSSQLPLREENGETVLPFFWLDAYEDPLNQPGTVFLFGKVKCPNTKLYSSCCVQVRNIDRCLYLLPREKVLDKSGNETDQVVQMKDIYEEFNSSYAVPYKIMRFSSKRVEKKYAFEKTDVPASSEYLEIKYSAKYRALPPSATGRTFNHVFGANTSSVERLILSQQIKGPCWLAVSSPGPSASVSWCKFECVVASPDHVRVMAEQPPPPPLVVVSISCKTIVNPKTNTNEVLAIGVLQHNSISLETPPTGPWSKAYHSSFCGVRRLADQKYPYDFNSYLKSQEGSFIEAVPTERALLGYFLAKLHKIDPDVIVGHRISDFDLDVLVHRIHFNKVPNWSRMSRLKRTAAIKGRISTQQIACGRLVCDTNISSKELIRARSYDLTTLAHQVLRFTHPTVAQEEVVHAFGQTKTLRALIAHTMNEALVSLGIMIELNILPLAYQITRIAGNLFSRTLLGGRSERNEYLLLHAFTAKGYICPDKPAFGRKFAQIGAEDHEEEQAPKGARKKAAYSGGLVLEPKKGFYDSFILLLDFNSLYPSIIQEYNIDFTTVPHWQLAIQEPDHQLDPPGESAEPGILPTEIRILVQRRREVKNLMKNAPKNSEQCVQLDIRQKALKLTANSMYGCLGFSHSRFYAQPLAALITSRGREILSHTKDLVERMNLEVIYGDTDSIMINTNCREFSDVMDLGQKVKAEVNKFYRLVELDIDGVFKTMLLLKKKKYAAISVAPGPMGGPLVETMEMKGLDIVRRDWCDLAKETGEWVLKQILSGEAREDLVEKVHEYLRQIGESVSTGQVPLAKFIITKSLTKAPENYPDAKSLPHVLVAQRLISKGTRVQAGDVVPYAICCNASEDTPTTPAVQRAFHPREVEENEQLVMDTQYYLQQQVHAVVTRLCEPIEGTDAAQIAHCLGLNPSQFKSSVAYDETDEPSLLLTSKDEADETYKDCEPLQFDCPKCKGTNMYSADCLREKAPVLYTRRCQQCSTDLPMGFVCVRVQYAIRKHIQRYYAGWMKCEDPTCGFRTRATPVHVRMECRQCKQGHLRTEFTPFMLYQQLRFYKKVLGNTGKPAVFKEEDKTVEFYLSKSDYSRVNLDQLFSGLSTMNT